MRLIVIIAIWLILALCAIAGDVEVDVRFQAVVGAEKAVCGRSYAGVGITAASIRLKDLRFYVHNLRLLDNRGHEVPVQLVQSPWQYEDLALLDFEDGTGGCSNGTTPMHTIVAGTVPAGQYRGLRFTLGVPFNLNHTDPTDAPAPLNLTAFAWTWNAGRMFARIELASAASPRGGILHLGSTGCRPNKQASVPPVSCSQPNRVEVELPDFELSSVVLADLAALFHDSDLDHAERGCMSDEENPECTPLLRNLRSFFRVSNAGK
jgi:uncharacterized repeat protein (TIGR04052 family)